MEPYSAGALGLVVCAAAGRACGWRAGAGEGGTGGEWRQSCRAGRVNLGSQLGFMAPPRTAPSEFIDISVFPVAQGT